MDHILAHHPDGYHTPDDRPCPICEGGLALCTVCGGAEASLPTECPGVRMSDEQSDLVQAGKLDYRNGLWVRPELKPLHD